MNNVLNFLHWLSLAVAIWSTCAVARRILDYNLVVRDKMLMLQLRLQGGRVPVLRIKLPIVLGFTAWKMLMLQLRLQGRVPVLRIKLPIVLGFTAWLWFFLV